MVLILTNSFTESATLHSPRVKEHVKVINKLINKCTRDKKTYKTILMMTSIRFVPQGNKIAGTCYPFGARIELDPFYWETLPYHQQEELLLHEVGHCVFKFPHEDAPDIMQASGTLGNDYIRKYNYYVNKFFGCKKSDCCDITWREIHQ